MSEISLKGSVLTVGSKEYELSSFQAFVLREVWNNKKKLSSKVSEFVREAEFFANR